MNLFEDTANALKHQQGPYEPGENPLALAVLASKPQPWKPDINQVAADLRKALYKRTLDKAIATIQYPHDGSLTPYVAIHRAITEAWNARDQGNADNIDAIAEALEQVLTDQGWLSEGQTTGLDVINRAD